MEAVVLCLLGKWLEDHCKVLNLSFLIFLLFSSL